MYSDEYLCILIATIFQLEKYYEGSHMMEQCVCVPGTQYEDTR